MLPAPKLREYQSLAVAAVEGAWADGIQRPALLLATGTGKTVIMAELVRRALGRGRRVLVLVHRDELVRQTVDKLLAVAGEFSVGVIQADRHEVEADVVVASVATLWRRLGTGPKGVPADRFDVIITDECHHGAAKTYLAIYDHFGGRTPGSGTVMLGVTATLERGDAVGLGHVWESVVFTFGAKEAIEAEWLVPPIAHSAAVDGLDMAGVRVHHGDWSDGDLGAKMIRAGRPIGKAILTHGIREDGTLRRGITFAPTIECAHGWCAEFNEMGIASRVVIGETPHDLRQAIYRGTHHGAIDMIVSVMCLTEGFDLPAVEMAVIGRPTKKLPLYVQMIGRVLRPSKESGKTNALILDVCGVMDQESPLAVSLADLGLPQACECSGCDCRLRYLCVASCHCPAPLDGLPIPHAKHRCTHGCRIGAPPPGPAQEREVDHSAIVLREVDLLGDVRKAVTPRGRTPWLMTDGGKPFLPGNGGGNPVTVFLHHEDDGTWTVGTYEGSERPQRREEHLEFPLAVQAALGHYGRKPGPLGGSASNGQLGVLAANGIEVPEGLSKQAASEAISVLFASRKLDAGR